MTEHVHAERIDKDRGGIPVGAKSVVYHVRFTPGGEEALIEGTSRRQVQAQADDLVRNLRFFSNGADFRVAGDDDMTKAKMKSYITVP